MGVGSGWEQEGSGAGMMKGESTRRDRWDPGIMGHLREELETQWNGNSKESMRVTQAKTPINEEDGA